jgi:hypothetical protein
MSYVQKKLAEAFEEVRNKSDWKLPVNKLIFKPGKEKREMITEAVIYFTGSAPEFIRAGGGRVRVKANGYYATLES